MRTAGFGYRRAMVTGASSGIGASIARAAAARGCDLVLVARRAELLEALAAELRQRYGRTVEVLPADLTDAAELAQVVARAIESEPGRRIDLLVNNAGGGSGRPRPLAKRTAEELGPMVSLNVCALMELTRAVLPGMCEAGRGGILNVASVAAFIPQPQGAVYGATKAFVTAFTETVHCEVRGFGLHVAVLCPGFTRRGPDGAAGGSRRLPEWAWLDRDAVAEQALTDLAAGVPVIVPGRAYRIALGAIRVLPRELVRRAFIKLWMDDPAPRAGSS